MNEWNTISWDEVFESIARSFRQRQASDWNSLKVTYELPIVERLWQPFVGGRVLLHRIHPHEGRSLVHPHPWPSRTYILRGSYEMSVGQMIENDHSQLLDEYQEDALIYMNKGSSYTMTNPKSYHSVRVISPDPVLSVMLIGPLYDRAEPFMVPPKQPVLSPEETVDLIQDFARILC